MPGVSGGGKPPEPVTDGTSERGRCVYWLNEWFNYAMFGDGCKKKNSLKGAVI